MTYDITGLFIVSICTTKVQMVYYHNYGIVHITYKPIVTEQDLIQYDK